jgi:WD40 repeat protein
VALHTGNSMDSILSMLQDVHWHEKIVEGLEQGVVKVTEAGFVRFAKAILGSEPALDTKPTLTSYLTQRASGSAGARTVVSGSSSVISFESGRIVGFVDPGALSQHYIKQARTATGAGKLLAAASTVAKVILPILAPHPATLLPSLLVFGGLAIADAARRSLNAQSIRAHEHVGRVHADLVTRIEAVHADLTLRAEHGFAQLGTAVKAVHDEVRAFHFDWMASIVAEAEDALSGANKSAMMPTLEDAKPYLVTAASELHKSRSRLHALFDGGHITSDGKAALARLYTLSVYAEIAIYVRQSLWRVATLTLNESAPRCIDYLGVAADALLREREVAGVSSLSPDSDADARVIDTLQMLRSLARLLLELPTLLQYLQLAGDAEWKPDQSACGVEILSHLEHDASYPTWLQPPSILAEDKPMSSANVHALTLTPLSDTILALNDKDPSKLVQFASAMLALYPGCATAYMVRAKAGLQLLAKETLTDDQKDEILQLAFQDVDCYAVMTEFCLSSDIVLVRLQCLLAAGYTCDAGEAAGAVSDGAVVRRLRYLAVLTGANRVEESSVASQPRIVLASGSHDNTIKLWDADVASEAKFSINDSVDTSLATLRGHTSHVWCLCMLPDGRLASGSQDNTIKLWDAGICLGTKPSNAASACLATLSGHSDYVRSLCMLPDGRLASGSGDATIKIWNVGIADGKRYVGGMLGNCMATLSGHTACVVSLCMLPDGRLASGSGDATIKIWNVGTGPADKASQAACVSPCVVTFAGHSDRVVSLCMLPDGRLASSSDDKTIKLWNVGNGRDGKYTSVKAVDSCLATLRGHCDRVLSLCMLPDGRLASASGDTTIKIWTVDIRPERKDASTGGREDPCLATLSGHNDYVRSLCTLPDGRLVSGSSDKSMKVWNLEVAADSASSVRCGGTCLATMKGHDEAVWSLCTMSQPSVLPRKVILKTVRPRFTVE